VFGSSATDVWVAYDDHTSYHFDGTSWTPVAMSTNAMAESESVLAITGTGGEMLAVGTDGMLYRYAGGTWYRVSTGITARVPDPLNLLQGVVASPTDVFVSGSKADPSGFGYDGYVRLSIICPSVIGAETPDVPGLLRAAGGPDGSATELHERAARGGAGGRAHAWGQRGGEEAWRPADHPDELG
jgi:hypothetical protein